MYTNKYWIILLFSVILISLFLYVDGIFEAGKTAWILAGYGILTALAASQIAHLFE